MNYLSKCLFGLMLVAGVQSTGYAQYFMDAGVGSGGCANGRCQMQPVYSQPAQSYSVMSQASVQVPMSSTIDNCGCSTSNCSTQAFCDLIVRPGSKHHKEVKKQVIPWTPPNVEDCECDTETVPFYISDINQKITVKLPKKYKRSVERYTFQRKSFQVCGCVVEVCVPCEIVCHEEEGCIPVDMTIDVVVRERTQPVAGAKVYDIWANNVKGLPNPAVLGVSMTSSQIKNKYKIQIP
jgi:hypothetical protein